MYEMDLVTEGYAGAGAAGALQGAEDLSGRDVALCAAGALVFAGGAASFVALAGAKSHFEDDLGNKVYADRDGFAGMSYFIKGDDGRYVQIPDEVVRTVPDNWAAAHETALGLGSFAILGGGGLFCYGLYKKDE